jgi:hypothetical protein
MLCDPRGHEVELALIVLNEPDALVCRPPPVSSAATSAGREALRSHCAQVAGRTRPLLSVAPRSWR